jgi:dTDP-4-dehydrorhamnose reductase
MHNVETCELEPERAYAVNSLGARHLAMMTRDLGAVLLHVSTDYVFDGHKESPYVEEDAPLPLNVYGNTKLAGEHFVRSINEKHFVLRTSALYGQNPCRAKGGRNFVDLMLKLGRERGHVRVVDSEIVSPTSTQELAQQIAALSQSNAFGLYHTTAEGSCSWHEFACEIFAAANMKVRCEVAGDDEFPAKVPRPIYSVLENAGLKRLGLNRFRHWREGLQAYLEKSCSVVS